VSSPSAFARALSPSGGTRPSDWLAFSPIRDETGGIGGLCHPATETTSRLLSERRTRALRDLAARTGKRKRCRKPAYTQPRH
jgi:hypothetical protein